MDTDYTKMAHPLYEATINHNKNKGLSPEEAESPQEVYKTMQEMRLICKRIQNQFGTDPEFP